MSALEDSSWQKFFWTIDIVFLLEWIILAFNVVDRQTWALENVLVFLLVPATIYFRKWLSKSSYFFIFIFTSLHILGSHYTYSLVPYDRWTENLFGYSLNEIAGWERNNYDRIIHFLFGVLLFHPLRELFGKTTMMRNGLLSVFTILIILVASTLYELIEFGAAVIFGGNLGLAYMGAQGDIWDSEKDQLLAILGTFIGYFISKAILKWDKRVVGHDA